MKLTMTQKRIGIVLLAVILAVSAAFAVFSGVRSVRIRNQIEIAQQFLNDLDYQAALLAFQGILQIDAKNTDARIGIAEIYAIWGQYADAVDILQEAPTYAGDEQLQALAADYDAQIPRPDDLIEIADEQLEAYLSLIFDKPADQITQADLDTIIHIGYYGFMYPSVTITLSDGTEFGELLVDADGNILDDYDWENSVASFAADFNEATIPVFAKCRNAQIDTIQLMLDAPLSIIAQLKNLTSLDLFAYDLTDLSFLSTMPHLETLSMCGCDVADFKQIFRAPGLKNLIIDADFLSMENDTLSLDLTGISRQKNLTALHIHGYTDISGVSGISELTNLTALTIPNTVDLSVLSSLVNLETLSVPVPTSGDLSPLSSLVKITQLTLVADAGTVVDITPLSGMTQMTKFNFTGCVFDDLTALGGMHQIEKLNLADMGISDISGLAGMQGLKYLNLNRNNITDISALASVPNLQRVEMKDNSITDVSPLANHAHLTELYLNNNRITDISGLQNLPELKGLFIQGNAISSIAAAADMPKLFDLRFDAELVTDLSPADHVRYVNVDVDYSSGFNWNS